MECEKIFNKIDFEHKISLKINELNNVTNILDLLYIKIREMFNKCFEYGYLKENSIIINKYSNGFLNPITFVPFIEYKLSCTADIFIPNKDDIYFVDVMLINKIGIMCKLFYTNNNKTYNPINIIIPKHTQKTDISKIIKGQKVYIKIIGFKFNKNSKFIQSIADIVSESEINKLKSLSKIINKLQDINLLFTINDNKNLNKYCNIVKFILNKSNVTNQQLFIYEFILLKNIDNNTKNYIDLYYDYIKEYQSKNDSNSEINININNNLESESNIDNIYDLETNDTDLLLDKSSNIDDDHEPDDDEEDDEEEDDEEQAIKMELLNDIEEPDSDDDTSSDTNSDIEDETKDTEDENEIKTKSKLIIKKNKK